MVESRKLSRREALVLAGGAVGAVALGRTSSARAAESPSTARADYSLQQKIPGLRIPQVVTVIGCGGFGAWPAMFAAMAGVQRLKLCDPATVDALDLARAPFTATHLGMPKVEALRQLLTQMRPEVKVETFAKFFTLQDIDMIEGPLFEGTNDMALAKALPAIAAKKGFTYVTGFYKGSNFGVMSNFYDGQRFESGKEIPVWIGSAAMAGLLAVHSAFISRVTFAGDAASLNMPDTTVKKRVSRLAEVAK